METEIKTLRKVSDISHQEKATILKEILRLCASRREYIHSFFREEIIDVFEKRKIKIPWEN